MMKTRGALTWRQMRRRNPRRYHFEDPAKEKRRRFWSGLAEICGVLMIVGMCWLFMLFGHAMGW